MKQPDTDTLADTNAACGKEGNDPQECIEGGCEVCQRECEERAYMIADEELFKEPPRQREDCSICFVPLPIIETQLTYKSCCGKTICCGCLLADALHSYDSRRDCDLTCPFCRQPGYSSEEEGIEWLKKRMDANDPEAFIMLGVYYRYGKNGLSQDMNKAIELFLRAADLGSIRAQYFLGEIYCGNGLGDEGEIDMKKSIHYSQLSAIGGYDGSRHLLGCFEKYRWGNVERGMKHFMIAAKTGYDDSLKEVREGYISGHVTKDEFENTLRAYKDSVDEVKSDQRDDARKYFRP